MKQRKYKSYLYLLCLFLLAGVTVCGQKQETDTVSGKDEVNMEYISISAEEAKKLMDTEKDYLILDVRTKEEYAEGHIKDAVLVPHIEIEQWAEAELEQKDQLILVYCRSGNRSKKASRILAELGYTNVREFGGIMDWPYEIVQ